MDNYTEMTYKEYHSIPFNYKTEFEEGMYVRLRDSNCPIGGITTYYKRIYDKAGNPTLKPFNVKIINDEKG